MLVATGLQVLGPLLIAYGINTALPLAVEQMQWMPAIGVTVVYLVTGAAGAGLMGWFVVLSARLTQTILFDLRTRIFRHTQRLSLEFHERYTSGRLIARLTSDLDTLNDLLARGVVRVISDATQRQWERRQR